MSHVIARPSADKHPSGFWHRVSAFTQSGFIFALLIVITLLIVIPFIWMVVMSFRTTGEILRDPYGLPTSLNFDNYLELLFDPRIAFYRYFGNSIIVTAGSLVLTIVISTLAGYAFGRSRYDFRFRGTIFGSLLLAMMLPPQIQYLPQFQMMTEYGLLNTHLSLILLYTASALPVSTYLMATFFAELPDELEDAAYIDGCGDLLTFYRVMLPLARPALSTVLLVNFLNFWNELLLAVTMITQPEMRTLPAAMMLFVGENSSDYAIAAASLVVSMLPVLIIYLALSDRFIEGLTAGALKG